MLYLYASMLEVFCYFGWKNCLLSFQVLPLRREYCIFAFKCLVASKCSIFLPPPPKGP